MNSLMKMLSEDGELGGHTHDVVHARFNQLMTEGYGFDPGPLRGCTVVLAPRFREGVHVYMTPSDRLWAVKIMATEMNGVINQADVCAIDITDEEF